MSLEATLANANATWLWQIYADLAQHLIGIARPLYVNELLGIDLDTTVYAFDATPINLCLSAVSLRAISLGQGCGQAAYVARLARLRPIHHPH